MIILINGASCTGKTYISQKILERYGLTYYSIEHIKMGLIRGDSSCEFSATDNDEYISKHMAPILEGIMRTALENRQNLIMEGCYFEGNSIRNLKKDYPNELICICLVMSENYCRKNFNSLVKKQRNIIEKRGYEDERSLELFITENKKHSNFSKKVGFNIFEISDTYEKMIDDLFIFLDNEITSTTSD